MPSISGSAVGVQPAKRLTWSDDLWIGSMRRLSVAEAKAHFSALISAVERGEAVEITRRGVPVARLVRPCGSAGEEFDLEAFLGATTGQPMHPSCDATTLVAELRAGSRY